MPVQATIPVTEDYRERIFGVGEIDQILGWTVAGNFLVGSTWFGNKLIRVNKDDFNDYSILTFPADGQHTAGWDVNATADVANGALVLTATGENGKTIRFVAKCELTQVTG